MRAPKLERLLAAAAAVEEPAAEMPYGFDTRVVALAHGETSRISETRELARLVRRIVLGATIVAACASSAAYWQMSENDALGEPLTNAYAIADHAIDRELFP